MNVLLTHGSSDARHTEQVKNLANAVTELLGEAVQAAFLSDDELPKGSRVLPLFLGEGQHGSVDAPALAEKSGAVLLPSLAAHADKIADLAYDRATAEGRRVSILFGLYRFTSFAALYAALHERNKRCTLVAHAALHGEPDIASVLNLWREDGVSPIKLQPMLLFDGKSMDEMAAQAVVGNGGGEDVEILPVLSQGDDFTALIASLLKLAM